MDMGDSQALARCDLTGPGSNRPSREAQRGKERVIQAISPTKQNSTAPHRSPAIKYSGSPYCME